MNITIISGSSRDNSQSRKVSEFLAARLNEKDTTTEILDLYQKNLPPYDPDRDVEGVEEMRSTLESSDGYVLVSPEWDGMVNHRIISFLHYVKKTMADKPVLVVGVSSSLRGGKYPVEQMRMMGSKNTHYVVIPEHLVVADVKNVMNSHDLEGDDDDQYIKKRADYAVSVLVEYAKALKNVRDSGVVDYETYPNGM